MDVAIEFSVMTSNPAGIRPLLDQFEAENHIHVNLRLLAWDSAWSMFVRSALYNDGPDVSEIGTTWIGDLVGMNALRSFNAAEVASLGRASAFIPSAWKSATQFGDKHVWAVPWLAGARLIYYRPDRLERAGIDPELLRRAGGFRSNQELDQALNSLQASGERIPWTVPTGYTHTTLLNIASWVWAAGGDFISQDGKSTCFMEPQAQAGLRAYFLLGRFLAPEVRSLNGLEPDGQFLNHPETCMTISGPWLFLQARQRGLGDQIGVALPPGATFVGGSDLVIWKYSRFPEAALKLVRFLTQAPAQISYAPSIGLLPARLDVLGEAPFGTDPFWQTAVSGLRSGRSFPAIRLWGLVEDRLTAGFSAVWTELLSNLEMDPLPALEKHLAPLAKRLDELLKQG